MLLRIIIVSGGVADAIPLAGGVRGDIRSHVSAPFQHTPITSDCAKRHGPFGSIPNGSPAFFFFLAQFGGTWDYTIQNGGGNRRLLNEHLVSQPSALKDNKSS